MSMHKQMIGKVGPGSAPKDVTLADYIERKQDKPKMDFYEWLVSAYGITYGIHFPKYEITLMEAAWKAAQENA